MRQDNNRSSTRTARLRDLNDLTDRGNFILTDATNVTNTGVILASATPPGRGPDHSVILTPVHERGQITADLGWALAQLLQKH